MVGGDGRDNKDLSSIPLISNATPALGFGKPDEWGQKKAGQPPREIAKTSETERDRAPNFGDEGAQIRRLARVPRCCRSAAEEGL